MVGVGRVDTLTRSECIIVIIYGWYQSFILISWWGYQCFGFFNQKMWDWVSSKTRPRFRVLAPAQRAAGGCPPPKAIPDREPAARRNFFWISMFSIQKLMIFRDNNGFKTCLVPGAINYYDKLSIIGSSVNVLFLSFCRLLVLVPMFYFPIFDGTNHLLW